MVALPSGKYFEAVGRRKTAVARVRLFEDKKGKIIINGQEHLKFLDTLELVRSVELPLKATGVNNFSVYAKVNGGGIRGQAEAVRHGIARALLLVDKEWRTTLRPLGYLTRDPRQKERKKPGLKRARRAPQWAKR